MLAKYTSGLYKYVTIVKYFLYCNVPCCTFCHFLACNVYSLFTNHFGIFCCSKFNGALNRYCTTKCCPVDWVKQQVTNQTTCTTSPTSKHCLVANRECTTITKTFIQGLSLPVRKRCFCFWVHVPCVSKLSQTRNDCSLANVKNVNSTSKHTSNTLRVFKLVHNVTQFTSSIIWFSLWLWQSSTRFAVWVLI